MREVVHFSITGESRCPSPNLSPQSNQEERGYAQRGEGPNSSRHEFKLLQLHTAEPDAERVPIWAFRSLSPRVASDDFIA